MTAQHTPGKLNIIADALSHFKMEVFRLAAPEADPASCSLALLPSNTHAAYNPPTLTFK